MEKVKVSEEVFDALEKFKNRVGEKNFKKDLNWCVIKRELLDNESILYSKVPLIKLVDIAYCGYELYETKEDRLKRFYEASLVNNDNYDIGFRMGVKECLETFDLKLEGIND